MSDDEIIWGAAVHLAREIKEHESRFREVGFHWCWECPPDRRRKIARVFAESPGGSLILWALQGRQPVALESLPDYSMFELLDEPGGVIVAYRRMTAEDQSDDPVERPPVVQVPPEAHRLPVAVGDRTRSVIAICPRCSNGLLLMPSVGVVNVVSRLRPETWGRVVDDGTPVD